MGMANVDLLRSIGTVEQFAKNQTVFMQGDAGSSMYIVLKGTLLQPQPRRCAAPGKRRPLCHPF